MIRLQVEDYCHDCRDFKANVIEPQRVQYSDGDATGFTDTIIRCEHRGRCASIARYLARVVKETNYTKE